jgi:hypothetical protein
MITRKTIEDQIATLEAQQVEARLIIDRAEGGLQVARFWLGKIEREESEAKAATTEEPPA